MQISSATVSSIICKQDFNILKFNTILTQVSSALFHTLHISTCHLQRFSPYLSFLLPPYFYVFSSGENWHFSFFLSYLFFFNRLMRLLCTRSLIRMLRAVNPAKEIHLFLTTGPIAVSLKKMFQNTKEFSFMGKIKVFLILHMPCCN